MAAEMNRNIDEIRQKNLQGKRGILAKPPTPVKKPVINKVTIVSLIKFKDSFFFFI
jgi:hypothetical protein